jgi:HAD superfamily hydrolase (TIGR01509 family)
MDLVVFDCDGVLVDSESIACGVEAEQLTAAGFPITAFEVRHRFVGISSAGMLRELERLHGRTLPDDFGELLQARVLDAFESELRAIPGIAEVLGRLDGSRCVASSSTPARIRRSLDLTDLRHYFEPHIFSASQVERGKPAPDLFLFAAAQMRVAPARCVVVEDSVFGVAGAVAAGMAAIGFVGGNHCVSEDAERLRQAGARAVIDDMRDLPALLDELR